MDTKNIDIHDIIKYCQEHNEVAWLKEIAATKVPYKIYPRIKGEDGKWTTDKTAEPKIEMRPISFIQIKTAFIEKFGLAAPKKPKAPTMYDVIKSL